MTLNHILVEIQALPRSDKLRLLGLLVQELEGQGPPNLEPGATYPVWSPEHAFEGADTLLRVLSGEETAGGHERTR
jgi:hypothetical protein